MGPRCRLAARTESGPPLVYAAHYILIGERRSVTSGGKGRAGYLPHPRAHQKRKRRRKEKTKKPKSTKAGKRPRTKNHQKGTTLGRRAQQQKKTNLGYMPGHSKAKRHTESKLH